MVYSLVDHFFMFFISLIALFNYFVLLKSIKQNRSTIKEFRRELYKYRYLYDKECIELDSIINKAIRLYDAEVKLEIYDLKQSLKCKPRKKQTSCKKDK